MKCPRCGSEMTLDSHRKYAVQMCYECGYIEGRTNDMKPGIKNYERIRSLNYNELTAFISSGLGVDAAKVRAWLDKTE